MWRNLLKIMHRVPLCSQVRPQCFPWGWKAQEDILRCVEPPSLSEEITLETEDGREFVHPFVFQQEVANAYEVVYDAYRNNVDFLSVTFASPALSVALNRLRKGIDLSALPDIEQTKAKKLHIWLEYGMITSNDKFVGMYNYDEILHELSCGAVGPETRHLWDQIGLKQKIKVIHEIDFKDGTSRKDIFDWERDVMLPGPQDWQIGNMNEILCL
jgi:hypothetical protein